LKKSKHNLEKLLLILRKLKRPLLYTLNIYTQKRVSGIMNCVINLSHTFQL
jgi:hypothetical protein